MLSKFALSIARELIIPVITRELTKANVPAHEAQRVSEKVALEVAPVMVNQSNQEPWYQSRVTWGALVSIGTGVLALSGIVINPEDAELIVAVGVAVGSALGGVITLYGRWKAKKPIGS